MKNKTKKHELSCNAVKSCTNLAMFSTQDHLYCSECMKTIQSSGYRRSSFSWDYSFYGRNTRLVKYDNDYLGDAVQPIIVNLHLYRTLPAGLKQLAIPMKAFLYCQNVLLGPADIFEELIATDIELGLRYSVIKKERVITLEKRLLADVKECEWLKGSIGSNNLLGYVSKLYSSFRVEKATNNKLHSKDPRYFNKELEDNLLTSPSNIRALSISKRARIVKAEETIFHCFSSTLTYINDVVNYHESGYKRFNKFEKFIGKLYTKFFNKNLDQLDKSKIMEYCRIPLKSTSDILINHLLERGDLKMLKKELLRKEKSTKIRSSYFSNMTIKKRTLINRGKSLYESIYYNGSDYLVDYIMDNKKSRWIEAEPFMAAVMSKNIIRYIDEYVQVSLPIFEKPISGDISLCVDYVYIITKYTNTLFFLEECLYNRFKHTPSSSIDKIYPSLISLLEKGRLTKLSDKSEDIISGHAHLSFDYASTIKKRFEKGEKVIMEDANYRSDYIDLLKSFRKD